MNDLLETVNDLRETVDEFLEGYDTLRKDLSQALHEIYVWRTRYFDSKTLPLSADRIERARDIFVKRPEYFVYECSPEEYLQKTIDIFKNSP